MKIAIHAHVFYPELWDELAGCIRNFQNYTCDLFVTTPHSDEALMNRILSAFPNADYRVLENRGYDLGPLVDVISSIDLSKYDYVVKLHTKRDWSGWLNFMRVRGPQWREMLLSFCHSKQAIENTLSVFQRNPNAGMAADASLVVSHGDFPESEDVKKRAEQLLREAGLTPNRRIFAAGTMFIVRAKLLAPLQGLKNLKDFELVRQHETGTLAHVYERLLGYAISAQGMAIAPLGKPQNRLSILWPVIVPTYRLLARAYKLLYKA